MKYTIFGLTLLLAVAASSRAQPPEPANATPPASTSSNSSAPAEPGNSDGNQRNNRGQRGNFSPEEFRTRMMNNLREQLGVTKDDEWAIISERVTAVVDSRRSTAAVGLIGMRVGGNQARRFGIQSNPEADALQEAIKNNAPDAEIKARLEKFRQVRKDNEAKLAKAQEDLRAVLSVRQEAIAVSLGLLP